MFKLLAAVALASGLFLGGAEASPIRVKLFGADLCSYGHCILKVGSRLSLFFLVGGRSDDLPLPPPGTEGYGYSGSLFINWGLLGIGIVDQQFEPECWDCYPGPYRAPNYGIGQYLIQWSMRGDPRLIESDCPFCGEEGISFRDSGTIRLTVAPIGSVGPVPIPSAFVLLGSALSALGFYSWRSSGYRLRR